METFRGDFLWRLSVQRLRLSFGGKGHCEVWTNRAAGDEGTVDIEEKTEQCEIVRVCRIVEARFLKKRHQKTGPIELTPNVEVTRHGRKDLI